MIRQVVTIKNPTGLQAKNSTGNAKSVLSILGACVKSGDEVEFIFEGEDEEAAAREIIEMIESGLGE